MGWVFAAFLHSKALIKLEVSDQGLQHQAQVGVFLVLTPHNQVSGYQAIYIQVTLIYIQSSPT
jgi:hypothetical protein